MASLLLLAVTLSFTPFRVLDGKTRTWNRMDAETVVTLNQQGVVLIVH